MNNIEAIVFDLYGTLIYLANERKPYTRLFVNMGLQTSEEFKIARRIALTDNLNLKKLVKKINKEAEVDLLFYQQELEKEQASAILYPETKSVLYKLKERNIKLGLISNLASAYKKPFFNLGLDEYFDEVLFSCEIGLKKPDKRIYQQIVERLGYKPSQILMIGDKISADVQGPQSIGMNAIHLNRINNHQNSISSLDEVFEYL